MVVLSSQDRSKLKKLIANLPEFAIPGDRAEVLRDAGLDQFVSQFVVSGASSAAAGRLITLLTDYGRLTYEHEALGVLLNSLKESVGVEGDELLDRLLTQYKMMEPIARPPDMGEWRGEETDESLLEKAIGENTLRPIAFMREGLRVARSVAYVGCGGSGSGTGFMITPDLFITNHHVISAPERLEKTILRFNYEENFLGEAQKPCEYRAKQDAKFHARKELDYAIFELADEPGKKEKWGYLPLRPRDIKRDDRANIIQHPSGRSKYISFQNNFVEYVGGNVVQYVTTTKRGSSGSPVLNDEWQVVALHHSGGDVTEPTTRRKYYRNEGILITKILADLPQEFKERIEAAAAAG